MLPFSDIQQAQQRLMGRIKSTPVVSSTRLNQWLGHQIYFKAECLQTTGSFKLRGASNCLAHGLEKNRLPKQIVACSSGNHAQAVAYAAQAFGIPATIYAAKSISSIKAAATRYLGAELKLFDTRVEADQAVLVDQQQADTLFIPPFNHPDIMAGQGTLVLEAIQQMPTPDAVFAPCGGGGLLSGTLQACRGIDKQIQVIGAEPLAANDAAQSIRSGKIIPLKSPPNTLADGVATPAVGELNFPHLQQLDDFFEVSESQIAYWTQWLQHLLKLHIEPTSAMSMDAVVQWLKTQTRPRKVLILLTGGNIDQQKMLQVWQQDHLTTLPSL